MTTMGPLARARDFLTWVSSPAERDRLHALRVEHAHETGTHSTRETPADPDCSYCVTRSTSLGPSAQNGLIYADDPRLLPAQRPSTCKAPIACPDHEACFTGAPCALVQISQPSTRRSHP